MLGQWRARHSLCMLRAPVRVSNVDVGDTCVVRTQMSGPLYWAPRLWTPMRMVTGRCWRRAAKRLRDGRGAKSARSAGSEGRHALAFWCQTSLIRVLSSLGHLALSLISTLGLCHNEGGWCMTCCCAPKTGSSGQPGHDLDQQHLRQYSQRTQPSPPIVDTGLGPGPGERVGS